MDMDQTQNIEDFDLSLGHSRSDHVFHWARDDTQIAHMASKSFTWTEKPPKTSWLYIMK